MSLVQRSEVRAAQATPPNAFYDSEVGPVSTRVYSVLSDTRQFTMPGIIGVVYDGRLCGWSFCSNGDRPASLKLRGDFEAGQFYVNVVISTADRALQFCGLGDFFISRVRNSSQTY